MWAAWKTGLERRRNQWKAFFAKDLWRELPPIASRRGVLFRVLRLVHILIEGFREDKLRLHAASLTYSTLIALIPLLAVSLAVLKGLNYDVVLAEFLTNTFAEYPERMRQFIDDILNEVKSANFAQIGGIGGIFFILMVVGVLNRIEKTFNHIWGIETSRSTLRNVVNYIAVMVVVPLLLTLAATLRARFQFGFLDQPGLGALLPFFGAWLALGFLYKALPNTHVTAWAAVVSGFAGALLWSGWLTIYINFQPGIQRYNVVFGTLSFFPIFLVWLYVNWTIILLGAKIAFAVQNSKTYRPLHHEEPANARTQFLTAISVLILAARAFREESPPIERETLEQSLGSPQLLMNETLALLSRSGLMAETNDAQWLLKRDPKKILIADVFASVLDKGQDGASLGLQLQPNLAITDLEQTNLSTDQSLADLLSTEAPN